MELRHQYIVAFDYKWIFTIPQPLVHQHIKFQQNQAMQG